VNGQLLAGRYRLGEAIGRGGMGRVWRATDELLGRPVAVKELTGDGGERMRQEARAAARISHPNVVTVHDVVVADERPWIVMQLVEGESLADAVERDGPLDPRRAAEVGVAVLAALRAAHAAGVLHRDVKPANVLLDRGAGSGGGRVLLTDFGIAVIEGDTGLTRTGEIVGSVDYLAPERARGARPGPAADLWSLGATLFTAVEGYSAFRRATAINSLQAVVLEEAPPTRRAGALGPVIEALLAKDPAARPSAEHAAELLAGVAAGRPAGYVSTGHAAPPPAPAPTPTPPSTPLPARPLPVAASALAPARVPAPPVAARPVPYAAPPTYATPTGPVRERARGSRRRGLLVGVVVGGLVAAGGGFVAARQLTGGGGGGGHPSPAASDSAHTPSTDGVPKGYVTVHDPAGFSVAVPRGWKRQLDGDQIDYTPDDDAHLLRVGVERSPTSPNPYTHLLSLEKSVSAFPHYRRVRLHENTYRGGDGALWEFTWTSTEDHPGPRHAEEQGYRAPNGAEYEIYESAPAQDWTAAQARFQVALRTWKLTE
jgi:hypothetical protein